MLLPSINKVFTYLLTYLLTASLVRVFVVDISEISMFHSNYSMFIFLYMLLKSSVLKFETVCQGQCVNRKYFGCNISG